MSEVARCNSGDLQAKEAQRELVFWTKVTVSSLFSLINAVGETMRTLVTAFRFGEDVPEKLLAKLKPNLRSTELLKHSTRAFSAHLGADFELATGDDRWRGLVRLQKARRHFTHPERIEHVFGLEVMPNFQSSLVFLFGEMSRFFESAFKAVGMEPSETASSTSGVVIRPLKMDLPVVFSEAELREKVVRSGATLTYAQQFLRLLSSDGRIAADLHAKHGHEESEYSNFVRRLALRTRGRQLEALSHMAWFLLKSARDTGCLSFSEEDFEHSDLSGPLGTLTARVDLWSRLVGTEARIDLSQEDIRTLQEAWKRRDKLVHPRLLDHLAISASDSCRFALALTDLERQVYRCMEVDPDKWVAAYRRGLP